MALPGLAIGKAAGADGFAQSPIYLHVVTALLAIGLYGATSGILIHELRENLRTVVVAVTIGVLAKAVLIAAAVFPLAGSPVYAMLLGVAVAQIDPLSVASLVADRKMSESAKTVLRAWSSFDDPVTTLVTIYLLAVAANGGTFSLGSRTSGLLGLFTDLGANLLFAAAVFAVWLTVRAATVRERIARLLDKPGVRHAHRWAGVVVLLGVGCYAVATFSLFGLALVGLFLRPLPDVATARLTKAALLLATLALGLLLANGVNWVTGLVLGAAAYGAQVLLAPVVARGHDKADRVNLALSQQNGITAITLALLVEPVFPGTVAIIAPAILTVNTLHATATVAWENFHAEHPDPAVRELAIRAARHPRQADPAAAAEHRTGTERDVGTLTPMTDATQGSGREPVRFSVQHSWQRAR
jgi:hypothetical protein